jgi:hypothetical protein
VQPVVDVEPAMSGGEDERQGFYANHDTIVEGTIEQTTGPPEHAADAALTGAEPAPCPGAGGSLASRRHGSRTCAGAAGRAEQMRSMHPEFRTTVTAGELTVTGLLPGTPRLPDPAQLPEGSIAIDGTVQRLTCDDALELVDALLLVVLRIDGAAEERHGTTGSANRDRED